MIINIYCHCERSEAIHHLFLPIVRVMDCRVGAKQIEDLFAL